MPKPPKKSSKASLPSKAYEPTKADKQVVERHLKRRRHSVRASRVKLKHQPPGPIDIEPDHPDACVGSSALHETFGTAEPAFVQQQLLHLINATQGDPNTPVSDDVVNGALAAINGIDPKDEVEAMLATQMVIANHLAMDLARRTKQTGHLTPLTVNGNLTIKFLRTFTTQLEALQRYRGKGQQKIVVERVNVSDGGQAIVGNVEQGDELSKKGEEQSHAKRQTYASESPLRREDETGDAMQGTGG